MRILKLLKWLDFSASTKKMSREYVSLQLSCGEVSEEHFCIELAVLFSCLPQLVLPLIFILVENAAPLCGPEAVTYVSKLLRVFF